MKIRLFDFEDKSSEVDVGDIDKVAIMTIKVVTGDEILHVIYKDYDEVDFDSSNCRNRDYYDGEYQIYDFRKNQNMIDDPKFKNRKSSYEILWGYDEG